MKTRLVPFPFSDNSGRRFFRCGGSSHWAMSLVVVGWFDSLFRRELALRIIGSQMGLSLSLSLVCQDDPPPPLLLGAPLFALTDFFLSLGDFLSSPFFSNAMAFLIEEISRQRREVVLVLGVDAVTEFSSACFFFELVDVVVGDHPKSVSGDLDGLGLKC